jgi:hypothetical protein
MTSPLRTDSLDLLQYKIAADARKRGDPGTRFIVNLIGDYLAGILRPFRAGEKELLTRNKNLLFANLLVIRVHLRLLPEREALPSHHLVREAGPSA